MRPSGWSGQARPGHSARPKRRFNRRAGAGGFDMLVGMIRALNRFLVVLMLASLTATLPAMAQSLKLYVFDTGSILGIDPAGFHLTKQEAGETDMVCASYLIVHTAGGRTETLMWDSGVVSDADVE